MMKTPLEKDFPKPIEDLTIQQTETTIEPSPSLTTHRHRHGTPPDCMIFSVLVTVFCCPMIGVGAIFASLKVRELLAAGDLSGAWRASDLAKFLITGGALVGIAIIVVILFLGFFKITCV
ncbi:Proline rich transmembrane protein 1B [Holothuria leucospilota]|uniref:Proline rich transmembrane protein 1B n=1 Tax=Holothuria leucospilota TaxID=206669 RepID=A0A9Q1CS45_HOLLE|nr:Proline rich transmembrane protein 1B [Holothuria leucospilota]